MGKWEPIKDPEYMDWVRGRPCIICGWSKGLNAVHHVGDGIRSLKANDHMVVPICDRYYNKDCPNCHHTVIHRSSRTQNLLLRDKARELHEEYLKWRQHDL